MHEIKICLFYSAMRSVPTSFFHDMTFGRQVYGTSFVSNFDIKVSPFGPTPFGSLFDIKVFTHILYPNVSGYWHTATINRPVQTGVKQHRPRLLLGWESISIVCLSHDRPSDETLIRQYEISFGINIVKFLSWRGYIFTAVCLCVCV